MSLLKEIHLRYHVDGHLRFDLPASLCQPEQANGLAKALRGIAGVYRVEIFRRQRKLSMRFLPMVLPFDALIKAMGAIIKAQEIMPQPSPTIKAEGLALSSASRLAKKLGQLRPVRWVREKVQEVRETATAFKIVVRHQLSKSAAGNPPGKLVIPFLNDVLLFYLIKVHWSLITRYWLRRPIEFRYQWLATFYLTFLLVRSRQKSLR